MGVQTCTHQVFGCLGRDVDHVVFPLAFLPCVLLSTKKILYVEKKTLQTVDFLIFYQEQFVNFRECINFRDIFWGAPHPPRNLFFCVILRHLAVENNQNLQTFMKIRVKFT